MQPRDDSELQREFRENRNQLIAKWLDKGMLQYTLVWSQHTDNNKIAMCTEAMDIIEWSVFVFDTRMEDHVATMRRKIKQRKNRRQRNASSDYSDSSTTSNHTPSKKKRSRQANTPQKELDIPEVVVTPFASRARVSLIDDRRQVMAHGVIMDDEPRIPQNAGDLDKHDNWTQAHGELPECPTGTFKQVKIIAVCR